MTRSAKHKATKPAKTASAPPTPVATAPVLPATDDASPLVVLHVIRILALYLYVVLARLPQRHELNLYDIFFPETATFESTAATIEHHVHAALVACVQGEIDSNQFDGLIQEKTVFAAIKRVFRQQKVQVTTQCRLLVRLLHHYLAQLADAPIVRCDARGTLASTLEYLARGEEIQQSPSMSLLYPLVNAIDSLSIEQRECLDALTTLWRWLETCDSSAMLLDRIVQLQHSVIFYLEPTHSSKAASEPTRDDLGACFVRTLVSHADHIFRHDLDFTDPQDLLSSDSETEEDALLPLLNAPSTPPSKLAPLTTISPTKNNVKTKKIPKASVKTPTKKPADEPEVVVIDANEPVPANMMRVGIAAAAGTLAAALCVIFT